MGRLLQTTQPIDAVSSGVTRYTYDGTNNVTRTETKLSDSPLRYSIIDYTYNNRDRMVQTASHVSDDVVNYTQYYYDVLGNALRMYTGLTSPLTISGLDQVSGGSAGYSTTQYTYDKYGNPLTKTDPLGQSESNTYDLTGALLSHTDRNGNTATYTYDVRGRLLLQNVTTPSGEGNVTNSYTYAVNGRKLSESNGVSTTNFVYDAQGRVVCETAGNAVKAYAYNTGDLRTAFTLAVDGSQVLNNTYTYDALGRLSQVSGSGVTAAYTYDANGNQSLVTYGNGTTESFTFNKANLATQVLNKKGSSVLSQYNYTYDLAGRQVTKTDHTGKATSDTYDDLGQLTGESQLQNGGSLWQNTYQYDAAHNRASLATQDGGTDYEYDLNNRMASINEGSDRVSYFYDANGNLTRIAKDSQVEVPDSGAGVGAEPVGGDSPAGDANISTTIQYQYDALNRLTSMTGPEADLSYTMPPMACAPARHPKLRPPATSGTVTSWFANARELPFASMSGG